MIRPVTRRDPQARSGSRIRVRPGRRTWPLRRHTHCGPRSAPSHAALACSSPQRQPEPSADSPIRPQTPPGPARPGPPPVPAKRAQARPIPAHAPPAPRGPPRRPPPLGRGAAPPWGVVRRRRREGHRRTSPNGRRPPAPAPPARRPAARPDTRSRHPRCAARTSPRIHSAGRHPSSCRTPRRPATSVGPGPGPRRRGPGPRPSGPGVAPGLGPTRTNGPGAGRVWWRRVGRAGGRAGELAAAGLVGGGARAALPRPPIACSGARAALARPTDDGAARGHAR